MSKIYVDEIHPKTSGGQVAFPTKPAFTAKLTSTTTTTNHSPIIFGSVLFDTTSSYNSSTGEFTCPVDGVYEFRASVLVDAATNVDADMRFMVNGSAYEWASELDTAGASATYRKLNMILLAQLNSGDVVKAVNWSGTNMDFYGGNAGHTIFSGYFIG